MFLKKKRKEKPNTLLFIAFSLSNTDFNVFDLTHSYWEANKTKVSYYVLSFDGRSPCLILKIVPMELSYSG